MDFIFHLFSKNLFDAIPMNGNKVSDSFNIDSCSCFAVQYNWDGFSANSATIKFEGSNDNVRFAAIDTFTPTNASDTRLLNIEKAGYSWIRVSYTQTQGTGTLTVIVNGKVS